ncbi:alpha/beta fold hydrolase [Marinifilum sp. N1E240]|uniref:alpha/beta hydrolase n=1 Tax=Marinifilum sp. N1E240 TaxID=2608082 RepID=UPI00128BF072|nr:alpha/beta fold hydrolase [Marinifilum sp. N1E240]MPQ46651.1 alpha/beta fold hydrolase [Marinifilum sp. N1E240]
MKKFIFRTIKTFCILIVAILAIFYFVQEKLIFFPQKFNKNYQHTSEINFEEIQIKTEDFKTLHGLLFKSKESKGLIFYLHGNAGSIYRSELVAKTYTDLNYDVFMLDYRGFGKSDGSIQNQAQIFSDAQLAYNLIKERYSETKISIMGFSIGSGIATYLASTNKPNLLILQAPYLSLTDMMKRRYPYLPTFLLKYKFRTDRFIKNCSMPIVIFHSTDDLVIPYESSILLREIIKPTDRLITLKRAGHNGINNNSKFKTEIKNILN